MSIALYKYDNAVVPAERNVIYCQPLSTEEIYLKHLLPAVKHLDLRLIFDGSEIRLADIETFICELRSLKDYLTKYDKDVCPYLLPRIDKMLNDIDQLLMTDNDTVYLF